MTIINDCINLERQILISAFQNCGEWNEASNHTISGELDISLFSSKERIALARLYNEHIKSLPAIGFVACVKDFVIKNRPLEIELSEILCLSILPKFCFFDYLNHLKSLQAARKSIEVLKGLKI